MSMKGNLGAIVASSLAVSAGLLLRKLYKDVTLLRNPKPYVDMETKKEYQETRPLDDVIFHVLLFKWRVLGDGWLFQLVLKRLNSSFQTWDVPFAELGQDAETEVLKFCKRWGVSVDSENWLWSKEPKEYETMNEWFCRRFATEHSPERNLGSASVVMPATATVTWFQNVTEMPRILKNDRFTIAGVGIPDYEEYMSHSCALLYLEPADYHCFHMPMAGKIVKCELLNQNKYSVTVKPYILSTINILRRNRRAVVVVEDKSSKRIAMVIIGGVTVDSIRLDPALQEGQNVNKGQYIGCFARGGSSIAVFSNHTLNLDSHLSPVVAIGKKFKLSVGRSLASFNEIVSD